MEIKKLNLLKNLYLWQHFDAPTQEKIVHYCDLNHLSFQNSKQLLDILRDLEMWGINNALETSSHFSELKKTWNELKEGPKKYQIPMLLEKVPKLAKPLQTCDSGRKVFGECPVASEKTLCCNLKTIDAIQNCNYQCSYCSIQTFYQDHKISFEENLEEKLQEIQLDPGQFYHFGTGQSSDSLMWGNHHKTLEHLINFARKNANILLEFKTKSSNIHEFLELNPPKNVVCSWSLNPDIVISHEEHFTATLKERLAAAKKVQDSGHFVAFHFHPIIYFENFKEEYQNIANILLEEFDPEKILFISLGTLTFIKPAIKAIREKGEKTQILMMPLEETNGRYSYPEFVKLEIFQSLYQSFQKWHNKIFFYLCMEPKHLWKPVFGFEFPSNNEFETKLLQSSFSKIAALKS